MGTNSIANLQNVIGSAFTNVQIFSALRLVAAGFRLYKTSKADIEGGTIKAAYNRWMVQVDKNYDNYLETNVNSKSGCKVYPANK